MPDVRFVRAHDRSLSLWQSAVAEQVRGERDGGVSAMELLADPLVQATNEHVQAALDGTVEQAVAPPAEGERPSRTYLSRLGFEEGVALVRDETERAAELDLELRRYSDIDPRFLTCITTYVDYWIKYGELFYNDWAKDGGRNPEYGRIKWTLPDDAKVAIIGDWGTGLDDAKELLAEVMAQFEPAAIIHLGDIYYSGTPGECSANYEAVIAEVLDEKSSYAGTPVFTMAGNHDYYAFGAGFYPMIAAMNRRSHEGTEQQASYFCLRSSDGAWQFLAMDTGYEDSNPLDQFFPGDGPSVQQTELEWHQEQLRDFSGATVLLSHNQLFSAHFALNEGKTPYLNTRLHEAFSPYFASDVAAWLWGHEHNFAAYRDGLFDLAKGRLVGCSAYEELTKADPYGVNYPEVPYLDPTGNRLSSEGDYYDHGFAIVSLAREQPTDPVTISYYQYPSWGGSPPASREAKLIFSEQLQRPGGTAG